MEMKIWMLTLASLLFLQMGQALSQSEDLSDVLGRGELEAIKLLLSRSPDLLGSRVPRPKGKGQVHLLVFAVEKGDLALTEYLLASGADPNLADGPGARPPLHWVFQSLGPEPTKLALVQALVSKGAKLDGKDSLDRGVFHALVDSQAWEDLELMKETASFLKAQGASLVVEDSKGFTPLLAAIMRCDPEMTKLLLSLGADPADQSEVLGLDGLTLAQQQSHSLCRPQQAKKVLELVQQP